MDTFSKNAQISTFMRIRSVDIELFNADGRADGLTDERTEGQTNMAKLIVAYAILQKRLTIAVCFQIYIKRINVVCNEDIVNTRLRRIIHD